MEKEKPLLPVAASDEANKDAAPSEKGATIGYLDGLRGIAALIVYNHHHITHYYGDECDVMHSWGFEGRHRFGQLPFLQLFFAGGTPAVMVFFVLSGYVLTRGPLARPSNQYLINAALRRPVRLWLPVIITSLPFVVAFHTVLRPYMFYVFKNSMFEEFTNYILDLIATVNPFIAHGAFHQTFQYNPPVWTMAYELNGSWLVYALVAGAQYLDQQQRFLALGIAAIFAFEFLHFSMVPFIAGMTLAQIDVAGLDKTPRPRLANGLFVLGFYLLSDVGPLTKSTNPWFGLPTWLIPSQMLYEPNYATNMVGAICMVYAALRLPWFQELLNRAQWIGKISFALYLTHVPLIWFLAIRVKRFFTPGLNDTALDGWIPIPDVGPQGLTTRYILMHLIVFPVNLLIAEYVTRFVDGPSVEVSKQFAAKVMKRFHL